MIDVTENSECGLMGDIDGSNRTFYTRFGIYPDYPVQVYLNGRTVEGFTIGNQTIVMDDTPLVGDTVAVNYGITGVEITEPGYGVPSMEADPLGLSGSVQNLKPTILGDC